MSRGYRWPSRGGCGVCTQSCASPLIGWLESKFERASFFNLLRCVALAWARRLGLQELGWRRLVAQIIEHGEELPLILEPAIGFVERYGKSIESGCDTLLVRGKQRLLAN